MFETDKYKSIYQLIEKENFSQYKDDIQLVFIELPKFNKEFVACDNIEEKWIYFIKNARDIKVLPKLTDPDLKKAFEVANTATLSKEELELQDKREEFIWIQKNSVEKAKREGKEEGREEGKEARSIEIAKNLLDVLDNETIALKTGLDVKKIENLRII